MDALHKTFRELFCSGYPGAVIWDMDGVLSDTMELHFLALRIACAARRLSFPEELISIGLGRADRANVTFILLKNGIQSESVEGIKFTNKILSEKESILLSIIVENRLQTTPGVKEWLDVLGERRIPSAVASSSSMRIIISILEKLEITRYFDAILSGANLKKSKPDPEIFLRTSGALKVPPGDCLVIEDAPQGIEAALKAGMRCLAIGTSKPVYELTDADIVVPSLQEYSPEFAFL